MRQSNTYINLYHIITLQKDLWGLSIAKDIIFIFSEDFSLLIIFNLKTGW